MFSLPLEAGSDAREVAMPGRPAQVLPWGDQLLVTIRDPGLLLVMVRDAAKGLVEAARVALPVDAWGVSLTPDGATALVTSGWSHQLSAIDLATAKKKWSVDVLREPRAIVAREDMAYVTHLTGAAFTRVDGLSGTPHVDVVTLPPAPLRAPSGRTLAASLAYSATLSPDGARLFVARHALGALGKDAWFGASTVDVMLTKGDVPLAPKHVGRLPFYRADKGASGDEVKVPGTPQSPFTQPRAIVYRKKTQTLLVASEGDDLVAELDALALDPTLALVRLYPLGAAQDPMLPVASKGGAPSGIALSLDESIAWVWCRSTYDLAQVKLDTASASPLLVHLVDDALPAAAALGRRLFYNAGDRLTSGGVGCAGCHPDGRDDGFVWREAKINTSQGVAVNFLGSSESAPEEDHVKGWPRRTPILAGRVKAQGPYGWHAESETLEARMIAGMGLHRWGPIPKHEGSNLAARAGALAAFLRQGLVPPPREERPLTAQEEAGKAVFMSAEAQCSKCHVPASDYTDRTGYPMPHLKPAGYDDDPKEEYKVPSLLYVSGHGSLFHDGSAASLEQLVDQNQDRMGKTHHLDREARASLVAFLKTL